MQTSININIKGALEILLIEADKKHDPILINNGLVDNYKNIIRRALVGEAVIDTIRAYDASDTLLGEVAIDSYNHNPIETGRVMLLGIFSESSFNGTIAKLVLSSSDYGDFSEVTGLSLTKTSTQQLQISWTLTIIHI